jgi:hypothetical protein
MKNEQQEFSAPWGRLLKGMSGGVVMLFIVLLAMGTANGALLILFPLVLVLALPFMVRGYAVSDGWLIIKRLGWTTRFSLADLQSLEVDPKAMKGAIRLCGNGGLFSFTGLYRNKKLGNYRVFVNDVKHTVVLRFSSRTIVVSPDDPAAFVEAIKDQTGK